MTAASKKNFADIRADYQFFAAHTTEFEQDLQSYWQVLSHFPIPEKPLKFLDFGCVRVCLRPDFYLCSIFPLKN